ncbi:NAD(P)-dependent alcohol dehydrogenase [Amycolatopsis sp. A133]|uniref:zinc-dependent alcohol dehydrogenase family protein n=1 Tax=Amycolatopsis sp. A133 TaxID=3064472 RepID=UPI0027F259DF|nr:NAD(P)-dependent alcohol dehydrogenase [Amycolatopsis sp. A133]MDQ7809173.1 NAD(P)-dependent alcohol dehydrogenase [Amycolatopsis sp. A133]
MKYFSLPRPGAALVPGERDVPEPGPGQVLVRMRGWAVNARDLMIVKGFYPKPVKPDVIPLSDGAGEVVAVGAGVRAWAVGDRVAATYFPNWLSGPGTPEKTGDDLGGTLDGVLAEYAVFAEDAVVAVPAHLDYAEAATLPSAGVTAWRAVVEEGGLTPGQTVLTLGSGGLSTFALQFAALGGAHVVATSSSDAKLDRLRALGAAETVNHETVPEWGAAVAGLTGGGVDHVVDVGGGGTIGQSMIAARYGGHVSVAGVLTHEGGADPILVLVKQLTLRGLTNASRETFQAMNRAIERTGLKPVIDRRFPFDDVDGALKHLESGTHIGKVVLESA